MPTTDYRLFDAFLEKFLSQGYDHIDQNDPLVLKLERAVAENNQFFFVIDLMQLRVRYASLTSRSMFGIEPSAVQQGTFFGRCHPNLQSRHSLARGKTIQFAQEIYIRKSGTLIHSSNFKLRNGAGVYFDSLHQIKMFYTDKPEDNVFVILVLTDLKNFKLAKHGFHYYAGNDKSKFRFPDEELLKIGRDLSNRELEIIQLIASGLDNERISKKLNLSPHTINTHRRNILKKTGYRNTLELVIELQSEGLA